MQRKRKKRKEKNRKEKKKEKKKKEEKLKTMLKPYLLSFKTLDDMLSYVSVAFGFTRNLFGKKRSRGFQV